MSEATSGTPGESAGARVPAVPHRRVLIADDNADAADSLAMLLRFEGHEVTVVPNGRKALAYVTDESPEFVVLDIGMPDVDGYEVARQIRELKFRSRPTLIAITGWGQASDKSRAQAAGFDFHFTKPIEPDDLFKLLRATS